MIQNEKHIVSVVKEAEKKSLKYLTEEKKGNFFSSYKLHDTLFCASLVFQITKKG